MMAYKWVDADTGEIQRFVRSEDTASYDPMADADDPGYDHGTAGPGYELRAVFWGES